MSYGYLAIVNESGCGAIGPTVPTMLREMGMQERFASGPIKLFSAQSTPTLSLPDNGILVGHLFSRDGVRIENGEQLPRLACPMKIREYILENCWGEYLLLQLDRESERGFTLTRSPSPSGDLTCFYSYRGPTGFVTSDISVATRLQLYRKHIDWGFIAHRLTYPNLKTTHTGLADIHELLPGFALNFRAGTAVTEQVWSPWQFVAPSHRHTDPQVAALEIRGAAERVVGAWAETDKAVLLELSGGLDSSIIGACLRGRKARVVCCTVATSVPGGDERRYARLVAERLNAKLYVQDLRVENARIDFPTLPQFITPRIGLLQHAVDQLMDAEGTRHHVDSFFSGGGGDTVFGYLTTAAPAADAFRELGLAAAMKSVRDLSELHQCTLWKAARLTLRKLLKAPKAPHTTDRSFLTPGKLAGAPESHPWCVAPDDALPGDRERISDLATTQVYRDSVPRGINRQLRMPLLSQPVVEACLKVPSWMWIAGGRNRAVARTAFADVLPPEIFSRRSKGTFMGYLGAVYQKNKHLIEDFLLSGHLDAEGFLDRKALQQFINSDQPSRDTTFTRVLDLCMVENWVRQQS